MILKNYRNVANLILFKISSANIIYIYKKTSTGWTVQE